LGEETNEERLKPKQQIFIEDDQPCCSKSLVQEDETDTKEKCERKLKTKNINIMRITPKKNLKTLNII